MDSDGSTGHLFFLIAVVVASFLLLFSSFAASSLAGLSRARVQRLAEQHDATGQALQDFVDRPAVYTTSMTVIRLASLIAIAVAAVGSLVGGLATTTACLIWAVVFCLALVFGWVVPRAVAASASERFVAAIAWPVKVLTWLLSPVVAVIGSASGIVARSVGVEITPEGQAVTTDELKEMVAASEEEGLIEQRERTMIDNILELEDVLVREIMVPRPDIVAASADTTVRDVVDIFVREKYSRLPVYRDTIDDVLGVLYARDLFQRVVDRRLDDRVADLVRPAYFVPESKRCDDLLRELQHQRVHIAIVVDEYGGTSGLVTIEDLLEEIVGEIQDEFDVEEQKIVAEADGTALVVGTASIDDVNETLGLDLATEEVETIGGLLYEKLGRVPAVGDQVRIDRTELTVVGAHGRRVTRVRVERLGAASPNGSATPGKPGSEDDRGRPL